MAAMREQDYRIVFAPTIRALIDQVNVYLDRGYVTVGGPKVTTYLSAGTLIDSGAWAWFQAVACRYTEEGS